MAVTKILARKGRLDVGVRYVLNGDKTQEQILTARLASSGLAIPALTLRAIWLMLFPM